jgi:hypothetical protein
MTDKRQRVAEILNGGPIPRPATPACSRCTFWARATLEGDGAFCQEVERETHADHACDRFDERRDG